MNVKVHFDASIEADHCCFCGKPLLNGPEDATRKQVTVETTTGSSSVFNYHEGCFQEWLRKTRARSKRTSQTRSAIHQVVATAPNMA